MTMPSIANLAPDPDSSGRAGPGTDEVARWSDSNAENPKCGVGWKVHRTPMRYFRTGGNQRGRFIDSLVSAFTPPTISSKNMAVVYWHDGRWHDMERIGEDFAAAVVTVRAGNDRR